MRTDVNTPTHVTNNRYRAVKHFLQMLACLGGIAGIGSEMVQGERTAIVLGAGLCAGLALGAIEFAFRWALPRKDGQ